MNPAREEIAPRSVAVIGGGITGLAAAHRLKELDPQLHVQVLEANSRAGGVIYTEQRDGFLIEHAADMFSTAEPRALELCKRLQLEPELVSTNAQHRRSFIVRNGKLLAIPAGFTLMSPRRLVPLLRTRLLSWTGKLRLFCEAVLPARQDPTDESLASFATRRFGREAYERLIQPLISGIYTADPEKLSMAAAMEQFVQLERQHGSIIRGAWKTTRSAAPGQSDSGARYGMFLAPRRGMGSLVERLAEQIGSGSLRLGTRVEKLAWDGGQWLVTHSVDERVEKFDAILLAIPAGAAARLLAPLHAALATQLREIAYAGVAVAAVAYRRSAVDHPLDGFGLVVPLVEQRPVIAVSFSSVKFPHRAPPEHVLLRVFMGGACQAELLERNDDQLRQIVQRELRELIGARGEPLFCQIIRWPASMPQYHVGHLDRIARIEQQAAELERFALAGNAYRGVGVPHCIRSGQQAADALLQQIGSQAPVS